MGGVRANQSANLEFHASCSVGGGCRDFHSTNCGGAHHAHEGGHCREGGHNHGPHEGHGCGERRGCGENRGCGQNNGCCSGGGLGQGGEIGNLVNELLSAINQMTGGALGNLGGQGGFGHGHGGGCGCGGGGGPFGFAGNNFLF